MRNRMRKENFDFSPAFCLLLSFTTPHAWNTVFCFRQDKKLLIAFTIYKFLNPGTDLLFLISRFRVREGSIPGAVSRSRCI